MNVSNVKKSILAISYFMRYFFQGQGDLIFLFFKNAFKPVHGRFNANTTIIADTGG